MHKRRVGVISTLLAFAAPAPAQAPSAEPAQVILLGTGAGPTARSTRSQPASLLRVDNRTYLIDSGEGVVRQLAAAGVRPRAIDVVFLTHLHFDHTAGLPALLAFAWEDQRRGTVRIYGPPGTRKLVGDAIRTFQSSADLFRLEQPSLAPFASLFSSVDVSVSGPAEVYRDDLVRIMAVENTHYATMRLPSQAYGRDRSYAYRIDTRDRSFVFTGDTGPSAAIEKLASHADVLISEVIDLPAIVAKLRQRAAATGIGQEQLIAHMVQEHLTPEEVGKLATRAGVGKVVLTHIASAPGSEADVRALIAGVKSEFDGEVVAGNDLDNVDEAVRVLPKSGLSPPAPNSLTRRAPCRGFSP